MNISDGARKKEQKRWLEKKGQKRLQEKGVEETARKKNNKRNIIIQGARKCDTSKEQSLVLYDCLLLHITGVLFAKNVA